MSCTSCTKKYGLFLRETGCGKCGFSFCSKCVKYSIKGVPKKVCLSCFNKSQTPENVAKSPESTTTSQHSELSSSSIPPSDQQVPKGLSAMQNANKDKELQNRLQSLKQKEVAEKVLVTDEGIAQRLATLKDEQYTGDKPNRDIHKVDKRSEQEKINDLVKQYEEEAAINKSHDPINDIETRLQKLRSDMPSTSTNAPKAATDDSPDDDQKFVKKILAEAFLDARLNLNDDERELIEGIPEAPRKEDVEELPWCTICNEDARIRCIDCDGELYCRPCYKEIHDDDEEYRSHRTKAFPK